MLPGHTPACSRHAAHPRWPWRPVTPVPRGAAASAPVAEWGRRARAASSLSSPVRALALLFPAPAATGAAMGRGCGALAAASLSDSNSCSGCLRMVVAGVPFLHCHPTVPLLLGLNWEGSPPAPQIVPQHQWLGPPPAAGSQHPARDFPRGGLPACTDAGGTGSRCCPAARPEQTAAARASPGSNAPLSIAQP